MEPEEYRCPITQVIMVDPVCGSDGRTYEKSAITEWLRGHATSPITREPMAIASLRPNYTLRSMIERYKKPATQTRSMIEEDHYYAIRVFEEEALMNSRPAPKSKKISSTKPKPTPKPTPTPAPTPTPVPSADETNNKNRKILTACCIMVVVIIVITIIVHNVIS